MNSFELDEEAPPDGYVELSDATRILASKIFGGLRRPEPVTRLKSKFAHARFRFRPHREDAAKRLREAIRKTNDPLPIYIWNRSLSDVAADPILIPADIARRLIIPVRGGLSDHPYRISSSFLKSIGDRPNLCAAFQAGLLDQENAGRLFLRREEFETWCERERSRGKWPSQRSSKKPRRGRPSSMNDVLRNLVIKTVNEGRWTAKQGVNALWRLLDDLGHPIPSHDTLGRLVDRLFLETGNAALRRERRRSRRQGHSP